MAEEKTHESKSLFEVTVLTNCSARGSDVVVAELTDLKGFLIRKLENLANAGKLIFDEASKRQVWICLNGDKGGSEFKLCATIGNVSAPNSSYHTVPLGMFSDEESTENIQCYLKKTIDIYFTGGRA